GVRVYGAVASTAVTSGAFGGRSLGAGRESAWTESGECASESTGAGSGAGAAAASSALARLPETSVRPVVLVAPAPSLAGAAARTDSAGLSALAPLTASLGR